MSLSIEMTLGLLGCTEATRMTGIQCYWQRIYQINMGPNRAVFAIFAWCFQLILQDILCI